MQQICQAWEDSEFDYDLDPDCGNTLSMFFTTQLNNFG